MSDHPSESRCKHDRRIFDACSECENEAELALQDDQKNYVLKLKAETARLTAELARVEKERDALRNWPTRVRVSLSMVNPSPGSGRDLYLRCDCPVQDIGYADAGLVVSCPEIESQLTAALTRAKSAEDRANALAAAAMEIVNPDVTVGGVWMKHPVRIEALAELRRLSLTPPGDAGKGGQDGK